MAGYPIVISMSVAPEYLSDSKSRAWTHTSVHVILFASVSYSLEFLYEIAHVGYVKCLIDYDFLLMIIKG